LIAHGRARRDAEQLATLILSSIEGAILLARVQRRREPLDRVAKVLPRLLDET
jgi:TetR/AcrR family transcriptional repressor of lmrAB and yxaGH operons